MRFTKSALPCVPNFQPQIRAAEKYTDTDAPVQVVVVEKSAPLLLLVLLRNELVWRARALPLRPGISRAMRIIVAQSCLKVNAEPIRAAKSNQPKRTCATLNQTHFILN